MTRWELLLLAAVVFGLARPALAEERPLFLAWRWQPEVPVDSFLVSSVTQADQSGTVQQFRVPWSAEPTCAVLGADATPDRVCARPPACLSPGLYRFTVQAERGTETSDPSTAAVCEALPGCTGNCQPFEEVNTFLRDPSTPLPSLTPVAPPDPAPLQALRDQLSALERTIPTQPRTPIVATPPT